MPTAINPIFPIDAVHSVDQLMDIAVGMEHEAATRYEQLAATMERRGEPALADTFRELAELEREHEHGLGRWAAREGMPTPKPASFTWQLPETFGPEADGDEALLLTPYKALSVAVRNEERAFAFYSYLAALAPSGPVQQRAEALAREELSHVAQLRALRRQAYHQVRGPILRPEVLDAGDWAALVAGLETAAAELDRAVADNLRRQGETAAADLLAREAVAAEACRDGAGAARVGGPGTATLDGARAAGLLAAGSLTSVGAVKLSLRNAEEIYDAYQRVAERTTDEAVLHAAQAQAQLALERLARVRSLLSHVEDEQPPA